MSLGAAQSALLVSHGLLDLGLAHTQHPPKLIGRRVLIEDPTDLIQAEAEIPQGQESMHPAELCHCVGPITRRRVHPAGLQQSELVVVPKHPGRDLSEPGEFSDVQHDGFIDTPSHSVKVKDEISPIHGTGRWIGPADSRSHQPRVTAGTAAFEDRESYPRSLGLRRSRGVLYRVGGVGSIVRL
jgi:hypothetical protein